MSYQVRRQRNALNALKPMDGPASATAAPLATGVGARMAGRIDDLDGGNAFVPKRDRPTADKKKSPRPLRRLTLELLCVILAKLVLLMLIWWLIFAPHPKPDTSANAIARRLAPSPFQPSSHP